MTLPGYSRRKNSGLELIGEVPEHWQIKRLRFLAHLNPSKSEIDWSDDQREVLFLPMDAVGDDGSVDTSQRKQLGEVENGYTYFRNGDVTFAKITPCFENGKGAHVDELPTPFGFGSTELTVLRAAPEFLNERFLYLVTVSELFRAAGEASMYGAGGQKRVPDDFVRNFKMAWPPLDEQLQIISFLDHETARIDALVAEQRRLIELLKEKRQAVISHAVTQGLDPNVPMKDSGVEWLEKIPAHWTRLSVKRVAHLFVPQRNRPETNYEKGLPWITPENLGQCWVGRSSTTRRISSEAALAAGSKTLPKGSIIANCVGNFGAASITVDDCIINQQLQAYAPHSIDAEYLRYTVIAMKQYFEMEATSATLAYVNQERFGEMPLAFPSNVEQREVIAFLNDSEVKIDSAIQQSAQLIRILGERRSALISAAVTGKIDVRDWQPPADAPVAKKTPLSAEARA